MPNIYISEYIAARMREVEKTLDNEGRLTLEQIILYLLDCEIELRTLDLP